MVARTNNSFGDLLDEKQLGTKENSKCDKLQGNRALGRDCREEVRGTKRGRWGGREGEGGEKKNEKKGGTRIRSPHSTSEKKTMNTSLKTCT